MFLFSIGFIDGQVTFQKTYGGMSNDEGHSLLQTSDSGYIIAGHTHSFGAGSQDVYLLKTDSNGDTLWTKTFGGTGNDAGFSIDKTGDGGYIIVGTTTSFGAGANDVYIIKIDSVGNAIWTKTYGGIDGDIGTTVKQTIDGGYIITGYSTVGSQDVYLVKTDALGNIIWTKTYGGSGIDQGNSLELTIAGGYIILGRTDSFGTNPKIYLINTDMNGDTLWTKAFSGIGGGTAIGKSIKQTSDGGYIIAGTTVSLGGGSSDVYFIKIDSFGNTIWAKTYGGTSYDEGFSTQQTSDGGYVITGMTRSFGPGFQNIYIIKTNSIGDTLWTKAGNGTTFYDYGSSVQQTIDSGYIIAGYTGLGGGSFNLHLVKTDENGNSGCNERNVPTIETVVTPSVALTSSNQSSNGISTSLVLNTGSGGGTVTAPCFTNGINELASTPQISVYPNPSNGQFNFSGLEKENKIEVFDMTGKIIYQSIATSDFETINISDKVKGIYFYRITKEMKLVQSGKIALQ